ncbi:MAG: hypothetical protein ACE5EE_03155, partial [Fidelibacterota bacterium]
MKKSLINRTFKVSKTLKVFLLLTAMSQIGVAQNYSLSFDGSDDYVDCGNSADFNVVDELTISVWIKPNEIKNASIVDRLPYSGDNGYRLNTRSDG